MFKLSTQSLIRVFLCLLPMFVSHSYAQKCSPIELNQFFPQNAQTTDWFGYAVNIFGDLTVVGSYDQDNGEFSGAVYVYRFDGTTWNFETKLLPSDGESGDEFGVALSVSTNLIVVGAISDDDFALNSGAAYIFRYNGTDWIEETKLTASDAETGARFGRSISISNDESTLLIASMKFTLNGTNTGAGYIYRYENDTWNEDQRITPTNGFPGDNFGFQSDLSDDGTVAIISAPGANGVFGSAYIFRDNGNKWVQEDEIHASDAEFLGYFGYAVAIDENIAVVSATNSEGNGSFRWIGASYVYRHNAGVWTEEQRIDASDAAEQDYFGSSVDLEDDMILIGADGKSAAYLFRHDGSTWNQDAKLSPVGITASDEFGQSVALFGNTAVVGAYQDDDAGTNAGSTFVYELGCDLETCLADLTGDGVINFFDVSAFLIAFNNEDPTADFTGDGSFNFFDVSAFLLAYAAGCP